MQYVAKLENMCGQDFHKFEAESLEQAQVQANQAAKGYGAKLLTLNTLIDHIKVLYGQIHETLFTTEELLDYQDTTQAFIELATSIKGYSGDNEDWVYLGEGLSCSLTDLITGAFWHFTNWHGGQSSSTYAALCALNSIYQPGMSSPPCKEDDSSESHAMKVLHEMAEKASEVEHA